MKYIKKSPEPSSFTNWKQQANEHWQPNWGDLKKPEKQQVHDALLQEQGFICCYCGQRIERQSSHIEHFQPRKNYPDLALIYTNLLASCPGYSTDENATSVAPQTQEYCGQKKGDWYDTNLTVSPLIEDCASYFRYTALGEIRPATDVVKQAAAQETIDRLGLNHSKLQASRQQAIEGILLVLDDLSADDITKLLEFYNQPDGQGKYVRFCSAVLYILQEYL